MDQPFQPGQRVIVTEEGGERAATFLRPGDPDEALIVEHLDEQRSLHRRDSAIVRYDDGATRAVSYRDVRPA
jgi:hypothetical protein